MFRERLFRNLQAGGYAQCNFLAVGQDSGVATYGVTTQINRVSFMAKVRNTDKLTQIVVVILASITNRRIHIT